MSGFLSRRLGRGPYWLLALLNSVVALLLIWSIGFVMRHLMVDENGRPSLVSSLWLMNPLFLQLLHLPIFVGTIWRLHDTGHRSWPVWLLSSYPICLMGLGYLALPIVRAVPTFRMAHISDGQAIAALYGFYSLQFVLLGILIRTIYLCCLRGDYGPNSYGPPPGGEMPTNPGSPDESGEAINALVAPSITAPPQYGSYPRKNALSAAATANQAVSFLPGP
jgi:uncharacterized membrane protein YhaH (DUF805 family)